MIFVFQITSDFPVSVKRAFGVDFINGVHYLQIFRIDDGLIVNAGTAYAQKFGLAGQADVGIFFFNQS